MYAVKTLLITLFTCLLLSSCGEEDPEKINDVDNPENVAIAFFNAIYNEKNVEKAASVCNPKLARLILHYRSPEAVGRHLFNMSYDTVEVRPDTDGVKVREQFKGNAIITIYLDGYYHGNLIKEVKRLAFIQRDGKWYIDKILKDPF
ncbi:hypothetical protein [Colwellia sp. E2M01]|uniref:hypothetical protein n=1 Tax=Colwellia sp. E2M01 TaxID=2841561 RepID=UPI001C08962D|nr:hypothetical protein [Colwellia sp. E2M01]MBU2871500.1 hypothetical protein [Colwellia sp. E2M01]